MRIVLLGPPGSGKTKLSTRIGEHCDVPVLTCNAVLRQAAAEESELGRLAKEAMDTNRVSDELLLALLRVRLAQGDLGKGFVLVDFPRNAGQADVLDNILDSLGRPLDLVLYLNVDPDELMERLVGRITCEHCGAQYNLYVNPPLVEGVCDACGARVSKRPDDYEETISNRLRVYEAQMGPLSQYYALHGKLRKVAGEGEEAQVWEAIRKILDATPRTVLETEPVDEVPVSVEGGAESNVSGGVAATRKLGPGATEAAVEQKAVPVETAPKKAAPKKAASKKPAPKQTAPKKPAPKQAAPKQAAPKQAAPKQAAPKQAAPKQAAPKQAAPKKAAPKKAAPKKAAPKKAAPKKAAPKKAAPKKAAPKKAAPKKAAPKKAASQRARKR